jgi:hypothetical protein
MTKKQNASSDKIDRKTAKTVAETDSAASSGSIEKLPPAEKGSADRPGVMSAEAVYQLKQRLSKFRRSGPSRPLGYLMKAEADLENRSQALQALSAPRQKRPDKDLLIYQLTNAVNTSRTNRTIASKIRRDTMMLYSALDSTNPIESILDRHIVAVSAGALEAQAAAATTGNPKALDVYLRHAEKMTRTLIDLIEARERRRHPKQVVVGNVKVEAGGQAIVGTIEGHKPRSHSDEDHNDESGA